MTKRERITEEAKQLLLSKPEGLRFAQLVTALERAFPGEPNGTLTGSVWNLHTRFPNEVYKAGHGLFRSTKYRSNAEVRASREAEKDSAITMREFDEAMKDIHSRFPHLKRDDLFIMWFLVAYLTGDESQAAKALVGGAGDKGIDAILVDESTNAIFIVQGKFHESLGRRSEKHADVIGLLEVAQHLTQTDDDKFNSYLEKMDSLVAARLSEARKRFLDRSFRVLLYFVTLGKVSDTIRNDAKLCLDDLSRLVTMEIIDSTSAVVVMRNYLDDAPSIPACTLEIEKSDEVSGSNISQRFDEKNRIDCWVLSMRGDKIAELYEKAGPRLFARNVRGYLGQRTPVNEAMRETLKNQPDYFFYYNNGITILCDDAEKTTREGREALHVMHPQIINGQQTTRTLARHPRLAANASVLVKVIAAKQRSSEDGRFNNLLSSVVTGTNWQSPIKQSDLRANDRIQVALERNLRKLGYGYIRKRQAASEEKVHLGGKFCHRIKKEDLVQAIAACEMDGYVARSSKEKLFDEDKYRRLFATHEPFFYLARYWLMKQVKRALGAKDKRREARWLVVSFLWSRFAPLLKSIGQLKAFSEQCQRADADCVASLTKAIDIAAQAAMQFYRSQKGKGVDAVDMATFFKNRRSGLREFVVYLDSSSKELPGLDRQTARLFDAINK
jgi:hypothetical protein